MATTVALGEVPVVVAVPMSYWRTVSWRLARDRATLLAGGVLALIVLSSLRSARPATCWGPTSRGATC